MYITFALQTTRRRREIHHAPKSSVRPVTALRQQGHVDTSFDTQPSKQQKQCPHGMRAVDAVFSMHTLHSIASCTSRTFSATCVIFKCRSASSFPYSDAWPERVRSCCTRSCRAPCICAASTEDSSSFSRFTLMIEENSSRSARNMPSRRWHSPA